MSDQHPPHPAQYPPPAPHPPASPPGYSAAYPPPAPQYPPQYPPHQGYPAPYPYATVPVMVPQPAYRSTRGLAIFAVVAAAVLLLAEIIEALTAYGAARDYATAAGRGVPPSDVLTAYDGAILFWMLAGCVAYVATCLWLWQARQNAELLSREQPARARGWIWAGWVVPVVALWFPFQIVRDIRKAAELDGQRRGPATGLWWGLWLAFVIVGQAGYRMSTSGAASTPETYSALGPIETFGAVVAVPAFAVWAMLVLAITKGMDQMAARMGFHTVVR
ncbi:MAG TPA: DUF4328 domain-containing protein [Actinomycetales bacterium]|nr:DUF4328 domain-containing protein [Actinomycetales bacterium]